MKSRLWTLVALAFLGVCTLAALAMASNRVNQAALTTLYERDVTHLVKLQRIENLLLEVRFRAAGVLLEQLPVQGSLNHVKQVRGDLKTLWQGLETATAGDGADAESVQALADAQKGWPLVDATLGKVEKALSAKDNAALTQVLEEDWPVLHKGFVKPVQVLIPRTREAAQRGYEAATSKSHFMLNAGLLAACVCLVVLAVVAGLTVRSLLRPLRELEGAIRHMADGDLATPVPTGRQDEVGHMSLALAEMQARLRHLVSDVKHSTENITTASQEVAAGSQDLSQRTEQAAAHLQTTASSMVQLTSAVSQSAGAAQEANQLAQSAAKVAQRGGVVVADVVSTMSDISASSKRIADIIGVIDGIAFQTNILALNAAVEAARAGEQGRGFAVVASEVRGLAQRSAAAAKEIKGLIVSSVEKVESGGRLVSDAGATMAEIVASVQRVTEVIGLISASTSEQSSGIGQVNGSVAQLDNTTQQNAALVEQSAAAAESLQEQALRLTALVGTFRLAHSSVS